MDERRLRIIENALFGRSGSFWHSTERLSDGTLVGNIGAMTHVIDDATKRPMSKGYHKIIPVGFGRYVGELGATRTEFKVEGLDY